LLLKVYFRIKHLPGEDLRQKKGVPQIQEQFPEAALCYNKEDYEEFLTEREWMEEHFPEMLAEMNKLLEYRKWMR